MDRARRDGRVMENIVYEQHHHPKVEQMVLVPDKISAILWQDVWNPEHRLTAYVPVDT